MKVYSVFVQRTTVRTSCINEKLPVWVLAHVLAKMSVKLEAAHAL